MGNYLVDRVRKDIWCNPGQDRQYIFSLARLTAPIGALNFATVMEEKISLPTTGKRYHVFSVGNIRASSLGLWLHNPEWGKQDWVSFKYVMNNKKLIVNLYNDRGIEIPRYESYYMFTNNDSLIIAIAENNKLAIDYGHETIYFKVYNNAYFETDRVGSAELIFNDGINSSTSKDITDIQVLVSNMPDKNIVMQFVNGKRVDSIDLITAKVGDSVEYYIDTSIKRVVSLNLQSLYFFRSIMDGINKYLIHYPDTKENIIDFIDDIDIYVFNRKNGRDVGFYFHRNNEDSIRMVTHRDYSISLPQLVSQMENFRDGGVMPALDNIYIKLYIRKSGYLRPLVIESNRIVDLYKMKDSDVLDAMVGSVITVDVWRAENLENSAYCAAMRMGYMDITPDVCQDTLGYFGASYLTANTPTHTKVFSGSQQIEVPYLLQASSMAFEYDENGIFLEKHYHSGDNVYNAVNPNARIIEMVYGTGDVSADVKLGENNIFIPSNCGYRVYRCNKTAIGFDENWIDVTDSSDYSIINNFLQWNGTPDQFLMVRTDRAFLDYEMNVLSDTGNLHFTLTERQVRNGVEGNYVMSVPMGNLYIMLNKRPLIEGIDYIVNFPTVYIINKQFLIDDPKTTRQNIHVRFTGFCNKDLTHIQEKDKGFIYHDKLSNNNIYDLRDGKVQRIIVNGSLRLKSSLKFSEEDGSVITYDLDNGKPYSVTEVLTPMAGIVSKDVYSYREEALEIDRLVSSCLTKKLPDTATNLPNVIPGRYPVYSPFINRIIDDLIIDVIKDVNIVNFTDQNVLDFCKVYEYLLDYDPIRDEHMFDDRFIIVYPHNKTETVALNITKYTFLAKVVKLYGNGRINISQFVKIFNAG